VFDTTRRRRFAPTFYAPRTPSWRDRVLIRLTLARRKTSWLVRFRLGQTTFADAAPKFGGIPRIQSYSEAWYLGNQGHYLTYVFTNGSASSVRGVPEGLKLTDWDAQNTALNIDESGECTFRP
jgi:hypothetical protein